MRRLGYIKLLHQQAIEQSYAPPPLSFSSVLAFHDVMEFLFTVAVAHAGTGQSIDLRKPFSQNVDRLIAPDGRGVSGIDGLRRVAHARDGFKHNGSVPNAEQIEHARRDAVQFVEANCIRFFGLDLSDVSILHVVPQERARVCLTKGRAAADSGDVGEGMRQLALAFHFLMDEWGRGKAIEGDAFRRAPFDLTDTYGRRPRRRVENPGGRDSSMSQGFASLAGAIREASKETDVELEALRHLVRLQIAGIDMARYVRFSMLAPRINLSLGGGVDALPGLGSFHYTIANYESCETFVVDSALRLGGSQFTMWMPQTNGDFDRARAAADSNGVLPDDWAG